MLLRNITWLPNDNSKKNAKNRKKSQEASTSCKNCKQLSKPWSLRIGPTLERVHTTTQLVYCPVPNALP